MWQFSDNFRMVADGDKIRMAARVEAEDGVAVLGVVIGDAYHPSN